MDETTKVIVATLSGFIIAFFAEPVKNYFANRARLHHLRVALYTEMIHNYIMLTGFSLGTPNEAMPEAGHYLGLHSLRTECYNHALHDEAFLFYQIPEATSIILVQGSMVNALINFSEDMKKLFDEPSSKHDSKTFNFLTQEFLKYFSAFAYDGVLESRLLKQVASKKTYKRLMEQGKETSKIVAE